MNRSLALVLTIVLVSLTGARAENLGVFGGHVGNHGCFFCHTPHSKGAIEVLNSGNSNLRGTQLGLSLGAGTPLPHTFNMQGAGQSLAGTLYLWANPVTQTTYTTWEGTTISAAGMTTKRRQCIPSFACPATTAPWVTLPWVRWAAVGWAGARAVALQWVERGTPPLIRSTCTA